MGAFDYPTVDVIREVLWEEGWTPSGKTESETVLCVDTEDVAEKIDQRLRSQGYLR